MVILYKAVFILFKIVYRLKIQGKENLPAQGAYIVCPNHHHNIDPPLVASAFNRKTYFMAKSEMFRNRFLSMIFTRFGAFPVKRGEKDRRAITTSLRILKSDNPLCIFPEGRRVSTGETPPLKEGAVRISQQLECPIIPVYIKGTYVPFTKMTVTIREPFRPDTDRTPKENTETLRQRIYES